MAAGSLKGTMEPLEGVDDLCICNKGSYAGNENLQLLMADFPLFYKF